MSFQKNHMEKYIEEKINTHPFVYAVHMAMAYNDISHGTFKLWVEEVQHDFISKHIFYMSPNKLREIDYNCQTDGRSFVETVKGGIYEYVETNFWFAN